MEYDVFISHASEDKDAFVRHLAKALQNKGLKVWYDELSLNLGDNLTQSINFGLANSSYGIVVISQHFLSKKWPERELNALFAIEGKNEKKILPIWYNITFDEVRERSPLLAGIVAVKKVDGIKDLKNVVYAILKVVDPNLYQLELRKQKDNAFHVLANLSARIEKYITIRSATALGIYDLRAIIGDVQKANAILAKALDEISITGEVSQVLLKLAIAEKLIDEALSIYCVKCRAKRKIDYFERITLKNG